MERMEEFGLDSSSGDEFGRFLNDCLTIFASLTYCYFISRNIPKGFPRLLSILPILYIFTIIPLHFSSFHLTMGAGFFISTLASFKLILFSFDKGPLSSDPALVSSSSPSPMTFSRFLCIACLPIKVKQQSNRSSVQSGTSRTHHMHGLHYYVLEGVILGSVFYSYRYYNQYQAKPNYMIINFLYLLHTVTNAEINLVIHATLARVFFNIDVDPPFGNYFFLSTSFQDFWGNRWNLMVSDILRPLVYKPVRQIFNKSWGVYVAILATFSVSGLLHELLVYYASRQKPCWDLLGFFVLHGICVAVEIKVKKSLNGKWRLNQFLSILLMDGFLVFSCFWLFFPCFERLNVRVVVVEDIGNFAKLPTKLLVNIKVLLSEHIPFA